uniref:Uncharacterized protein n=1 Tax=Cyanothece sp. (strain PCC 7425 / ATCC 29141) TaxID=395961 RepID=B8HYZ6_CYAP4
MDNEVYDLHLPNCWNAVQSALYQLQQGNPDRAKVFLEAAQRSLIKVRERAPR